MSTALTQTLSTQFDSDNTLGIAPNSGVGNFFVAYTQSDNDLKVVQMTGSGTNYSQTTLHAPNKGTWSPALLNKGGQLYLFFRKNTSDSGGDEQLYYEVYSNGSWGNQTAPSGVRAKSDHNPVVVEYNGQICLTDKDNQHHFISEAWMSSGGSWSSNDNITYWDSDGDGKKDWGYQNSSHDKSNGGDKCQKEQILTSGQGNPCTPRNPSMVVFNGKIYMAYKGGRTSGDTTPKGMYIMTYGSSGWTDPVTLLSNETLFAPALAVCGNKMFCIYSNHSHSDHLYASYTTDGSNWTSIGKISDDTLSNHKATDPFAMGLDGSNLAVSYVKHNGSAMLNLYQVS